MKLSYFNKCLNYKRENGIEPIKRVTTIISDDPWIYDCEEYFKEDDGTIIVFIYTFNGRLSCFSNQKIKIIKNK